MRELVFRLCCLVQRYRLKSLTCIAAFVCCFILSSFTVQAQDYYITQEIISSESYKMQVNPVIEGDKYLWFYANVPADGEYEWVEVYKSPSFTSEYSYTPKYTGRIWRCVITTSDGQSITLPDYVVKPYDLSTSQFLTFVSQIFTFLLSFVSTLITFILGNPFLAVLLVLFLCGTVITFFIRVKSG